MAVVKNAGSLFLSNTFPRLLSTPNADVILSVTTPVFKVDAQGAPAVTTITASAKLIEAQGDVTFTCIGGTLTNVTGSTADLAYSNMTANIATITATLNYRNTILSDSAVISKVVDGSAGGSSAPPTADQLKTILLNQITSSQLYSDLRSRIDLIDAAATVAGSVTARVKAESDARVQSISNEIDARLAADNAEANRSNTYVQQYTYSKQETTSAISIKADQIAAGYTAYTDSKTNQVLAAAMADVRNYTYAQADITGAISASETRLRSEFVSSGGATEAYVTNYAYSKADTTSAISASESRLRSEFVGSGGATEGYVTNYAYSRSDIDTAEAAQYNQLTTNYQQYAQALQGQTLSASAADVRSYTFAQSYIIGAMASQLSTITTAYQNYGQALQGQTLQSASADVRNYTLAKSDIYGAIAQNTSQLQSTVDSHTATLQTQGTSLNGLSTQYTIKSDINGYVTGYGLASSLSGATPTSAFIVNAGAFSVVAPGGAVQPMFTVGQVNGKTVAVLGGDLIADGYITTSKLSVGGGFDNVIPDPKFKDLAWWGRSGTAVGDYTGMNNGWLGGAIMLVQPYDGNVRTSTSKPFTTTPGATMRLEVQVELSSNLEGEFSVFFYVEGAQLYSMGCPNVGTWSNGGYPGWPIQFNTQSPKGRFSFSQEITIPLNSQCATGHMVVIDRLGAGSVAFGSCTATRVSDSVLIKDGAVVANKIAANAITAVKIAAQAVTADKIQVNQLSAVSSELGTVNVSTSGYMRSGQPSWNSGTGWWWGIDNGIPKFSVGQAGGSGLYWDGNNLYVKNPVINSGFSASVVAGTLSTSGANGTRTIGSRTVTITGGTAPYSISAGLFSDVSDGFSSMSMSTNGYDTVTVIGRGQNVRITGQVNFIISDSSGLSTNASFLIIANFGTVN